MEEMYTVKRNIYKLEKGTKQKSTHWRAKWYYGGKIMMENVLSVYKLWTLTSLYSS